MIPKSSFYLAPDQWREPYFLSESEAHHLDRVFRIKEGSPVRLFDGDESHGIFILMAKSKKEIELKPEETMQDEADTSRITLAAIFSKALRRSWFIEKALGLKAHALCLWQGDFSQSKVPDKEKYKWKNCLISGAKQCYNPRLPDLKMVPESAAKITAKLSKFNKSFSRYEGDCKGKVINKKYLSILEDLLLIVFPEGGFSPREVEIFTQADLDSSKSGEQSFSLGNSCLSGTGTGMVGRAII